jgi:WD40 repeat protein
VVTTLAGHRDWVRCLYFDRSEKVAYSGSCDTTVNKWDLETSNCTVSMAKGRVGTVNDLCLFEASNGSPAISSTTEPSGGEEETVPTPLVSVSARGVLNVWNAKDGACLQTVRGTFYLITNTTVFKFEH